MRCATCSHRKPKGNGPCCSSICRWTGAQVAPFTLAGESSFRDDPDSFECPLTLGHVWRKAPDQAYGVMRYIDKERHLLEELLDAYPVGEAMLLGAFYRERVRDEARVGVGAQRGARA